ncbi:MAG: terminase [Nitrososphaerales archaeon]
MDDKLLNWLASVRGDPLAFTMGAYPWERPGTVLEKFDGPMPWARELMKDIKLGLLDLNKAIQIAVSSGHGVSKSCTVAHLILWAFCTFPDTRGVITAETETQLKTKTWAELGKWFNLAFFTREHFMLTATALFSRDPDRERTWRIDMVPWSVKNPDAFAGLHNQGKRTIVIFDEASRIDDMIWETAEGALVDVDTEIMWLVFGNPTRNSGRFRECFAGGKFEHYWRCQQIDSRTVSITSKARIQQYIEAYGLDSDYVRVRVLGEFPHKGLMEFFPAADIDAAMSREVIISRSDPLALGVDVARYGANASVIFPRKGRDARSIERERFNGLSTVDLAERVFATNFRLHADGIMVDGGGVGGGVVDNIRQKRLYCYEVQFGGKDITYNSVWGNTGERYANNRAAMYGACRSWLKTGAIPKDPDLRRQMLAIRYIHNARDEILLERKEDLVDEDGYGISLDDIDALCLTFSYPLAPNVDAGGEFMHKPIVLTEWDPFSPERMVA